MIFQMAKPSKTLLLLARETHDTVKPEGADCTGSAIMCVRDKSNVTAFVIKFRGCVGVIHLIHLHELFRLGQLGAINEGVFGIDYILYGFDDVHILILAKNLFYSNDFPFLFPLSGQKDFFGFVFG